MEALFYSRLIGMALALGTLVAYSIAMCLAISVAKGRICSWMPWHKLLVAGFLPLVAIVGFWFFWPAAESPAPYSFREYLCLMGFALSLVWLGGVIVQLYFRLIAVLETAESRKIIV